MTKQPPPSDPRELRERLGVATPTARVRTVDLYKLVNRGGRNVRVCTGTATIRESLCPRIGHGPRTEYVGVCADGWVFRCKGVPKPKRPKSTPPPEQGEYSMSLLGQDDDGPHTFVATPPAGT